MRWIRTLSAGIAATLLGGAASVDAQVAAPGPGTPQTVVSSAPSDIIAPAPAATGAVGEPISVAGPGFSAVGGGSGGFDFSKTPPVRKMPMLGFAPVAPSGPGYYSVFDLVTDNYRQAPPKFPYPPSAAMGFSFFDANFSYLDDPNNQQHDWADILHRIRIGDDFMLSTGGELRYRSMDEHNSRLGGTNNTYDLWRTREYVDAWYRDIARVYVEFIWADSVDQELAPLPIDRNRGDFLNAFVDLKLPSIGCDAQDYLRIGRQELLLGSQRLVSPLDWANTRRTFDGVRVLHTSETFDADFFWTKPVIPNVSRLDSSDPVTYFGGAFLTYRPEKKQAIDTYYFYYDNGNALTQSGIVRQPSSSNTIGSRYSGEQDHFLWDVEGAIQFGDRRPENSLSGMVTTGAGYNWQCLPMNPTVWLYYDYASGDGSPNANAFNTFNQLYPFGHYYLGWTDLVGRQNINDLNAHLYLYPTNWLTLWTQLHHFWLAESKDGLYNAAGNIIRRDPTGKAGDDVGNEVDLIANVHLSTHSDFMVGYCYFFSGDFIKATAPTPSARGDSSLLFAMYSFRW